MPKNRVIYHGVMLLLGTLLIWSGTGFAHSIAWLIPYAGGIGLAMVLGGAIYDWWRSREDKAFDPVIGRRTSGSHST